MSALLGIDLGTSGLKAVIFDERGRILGQGYAASSYLNGESGSAEQNPTDWWRGCCRAVKEALSTAPLSSHPIEAVGVCGFHHCPVFLGADDQVVRPSIVTHDRRLALSLQELEQAGTAQHIEEMTGSRVTAGHFPVIYHYVATREPDTIERTRWFMPAKDYLRFRLTGEIGTELCDATGTHLVRMPEKKWSPDLCAALGVPRQKLPPIAGSTELCGAVTREAAECSGLKAGTPVAYGGGDSHCALVGLGVTQHAQTGLLLGTNSTLRTVLSKPVRRQEPRVWVQSHVVPGLFTASASSMAGARVLQWFKDIVFNGSTGRKTAESVAEQYRRLDALAKEAPAGSEGLLFLPYIFGERSPFYNLSARGSFVSLGSGHTLAHMTRSVLEGVAFSTANNLEVLSDLLGTDDRKIQSVRMGRSGGGHVTTWPAILAAAMDCNLELVDVEEPGSLGAAVLAGTAAGTYASITEALERTVSIRNTMNPDPAVAAHYRGRRETFNRVYAELERLLYPKERT